MAFAHCVKRRRLSEIETRRSQKPVYPTLRQLERGKLPTATINDCAMTSLWLSASRARATGLRAGSASFHGPAGLSASQRAPLYAKYLFLSDFSAAALISAHASHAPRYASRYARKHFPTQNLHVFDTLPSAFLTEFTHRHVRKAPRRYRALNINVSLVRRARDSDRRSR